MQVLELIYLDCAIYMLCGHFVHQLLNQTCFGWQCKLQLLENMVKAPS